VVRNASVRWTSGVRSRPSARLALTVGPRDLLQGPHRSPGRLSGRRRRRPSARGQAPRGPRRRRRGQGRTARSGPPSCPFKARGLAGVKLVIADAHLGLGQAARAVFLGAGIQSCPVHFMRNVLAAVPKPNGEMVGAVIDTTSPSPTRTHCGTRSTPSRSCSAASSAKVQAMLEAAKDELLAFTAFPPVPGRRSGRPTRWSGGTRRSRDAATSSASSPTRRHCCAYTEGVDDFGRAGALPRPAGDRPGAVYLKFTVRNALKPPERSPPRTGRSRLGRRARPPGVDRPGPARPVPPQP